MTAAPPRLIERLLSASSEDDVLVGGQALSIWMSRYGVATPSELPAVTKDIDFLLKSATARDSVERFARAIHGKAIYPSGSELTALVGQVELDVSEDLYINVDAIFQVVGLDPKRVQARALRMEVGSASFLVMHPLDVLRSRLHNLHELRDKQNDKGCIQLALAIEVARCFLRAKASETTVSDNASGRSPIQPLISEIEKLALDDAGRKVAKRWGQHVADAIDPSLIAAGPFWERKWPTLQALMSAAYAKRFSPPGEPGPVAEVERSIPRMRP